MYWWDLDILVAPVCYPGQTERMVYLPGKGSWIECGNGTIYSGGQWVRAEAPIEKIPFFVRKESQICEALIF